jgi:hypothetical protein
MLVSVAAFIPSGKVTKAFELITLKWILFENAAAEYQHAN